MSDVVSGAEPTSRRVRVLSVLAVLLVLLAAGGDRWTAAREREQLLDAVVAGEQAVGGSRASLAALAQYSAGALYGPDVPPAVRASVQDLLGQDARRWAPRLASAQQRVAGTAVLPWHGRTRTARAAYEQRLQAWADRLAGFAAAPQEGFPDEPASATTSRERARAALLDAGLDADQLPTRLG